MDLGDMLVKNEPPWLQSKVDQRLALIKEATGGSALGFKALGTTIIVMPLTEPAEGDDATPEQMERWENTCDNCGKYLAFGLSLRYVEREWDNLTISMFFGVCDECPAEEVKVLETRELKHRIVDRKNGLTCACGRTFTTPGAWTQHWREEDNA